MAAAGRQGKGIKLAGALGALPRAFFTVWTNGTKIVRLSHTHTRARARARAQRLYGSATHTHTHIHTQRLYGSALPMSSMSRTTRVSPRISPRIPPRVSPRGGTTHVSPRGGTRRLPARRHDARPPGAAARRLAASSPRAAARDTRIDRLWGRSLDLSRDRSGAVYCFFTALIGGRRMSCSDGTSATLAPDPSPAVRAPLPDRASSALAGHRDSESADAPA